VCRSVSSTNLFRGGGGSSWYASCCASCNSVNRGVYTTTLSTCKIDTNLSIFVYYAKEFATYFDLHKVITRRFYKNSNIVLELCFLIWIYIVFTIFHHLIPNTTVSLTYYLTNTQKCNSINMQFIIGLKNLRLIYIYIYIVQISY
jgi:hypothetical protein